MKNTLLIALILIANFVSAQTFTKYVDNTQTNGQGFCYNVTIRLTLLRMAARPTLKSAGNGTEYSVQLVRLDIDKSKGWYERGKTYNCDQLEGICNLKNYDIVNIGLAYNCAGREIGSGSATFYNVGDKQTIVLNTKDGCSSPTASGIDFISIGNNENSSRINLIVQKLNNGKSIPATQAGTTNTSNQTNNTTAKPLETKTTTGIPANTSTKTSIEQIPDNYKGNPMTYNTHSSNSDNKTTQVLSSATNILNQWASQIKSDNEAEEARQNRIEDERVRKQNIADNLRANKFRLINNRKSLIAKFPDGKTPLSYEVKGATEIFYFVYSYQASTIENVSPPIYISNVFSLAKYADGTWPLKASLIENITKTNKGHDLVLSGYYLNKNEAEQQQKFLINEANNFDFVVNNINYETKKYAQTTRGSLDYWGTPIKKEQQQSNPKTPATIEPEKPKGKVDYWGNPIKE